MVLSIAQRAHLDSSVSHHASSRAPRRRRLRMESHAISRASGDFPIDWQRAREDAARTLASIDWSRRDIVVWVPGTDSSSIHPRFAQAVADAGRGRSMSVVRMHHQASWNMRPSVATGIATMKLVLAGIAAHGGDHRVVLAGESQGAWIIGEAIVDPMLRRVVDRAVLLGHPWLAAHHYDDGHDPDVRVINNPGDLVTIPVTGDPGRGLDAMVAVYTLQWSRLPLVLRAMLENPVHGAKLISNLRFAIPVLKHLWKNPHDYGEHMQSVATFLLEEGQSTARTRPV